MPGGGRRSAARRKAAVAPVLVISTPLAYTIEEAAHQLGFRHRSSVYELIERGELVACRLGGGSLRVPADAIVDYLQRAVSLTPNPLAGATISPDAVRRRHAA